jgi:gamma-glutamyltranspeptidase/glutathione hydrolase
MLNILEGYDLKSLGASSAQHLHYLTESMRRAFRDRARYLADPDFNTIPIARLTSKSYASALRKTIDPNHASPSTPGDVGPVAESMHTTHYSVVDANGMAVSVTYTLEYPYGSAIVVPGGGFLLNNEMGDFNGQRGRTDSTGLIGTDPNLARPGQRMLSSMTPTIVAKSGRLVAVVGSPGGRTIINTVLQVVSNIIDFDMDIQAAVNAPRVHHQWLPDVLEIEHDGASPSVVQQLEAMGHRVSVGGEQGTAHSILIDRVTRARRGAADPRDRDAGAAGH